jgi:hypothetical protein
MSIDPINTGSTCAAERCTHRSHSGLLDDADAAAEARERALLAELAAARAEVERLRQVLVQVDRCLEHVVNRPHEHNPVGPFQRVTCEIVTDAQAAVRAVLAAAPPREERLAALGFEHPKPGSGTVGELIGLKPVEEAPAPLWLDDWPEEEETEHLAALRRHTKGGGNG